MVVAIAGIDMVKAKSDISKIVGNG